MRHYKRKGGKSLKSFDKKANLFNAINNDGVYYFMGGWWPQYDQKDLAIIVRAYGSIFSQLKKKSRFMNLSINDFLLAEKELIATIDGLMKKNGK